MTGVKPFLYPFIWFIKPKCIQVLNFISYLWRLNSDR